MSSKEIFRNASTTYYNSSLFFDRKTKEAIFTLYSWVRTVDDFIDQTEQDREGYQNFKDDFYSSDPKNQINIEFQKFIKFYEIKDENIRSFLDSMEMDLEPQSVYTEKQLEKYIYGSAEVIGLMICKVLNINDKDALRSARYLGDAMQRINMIRDIAIDIELGRSYILTQELRTRHNIESIVSGTQLEEGVLEQILDYNDRIDKARKGFKYLPYRARVAVATATDMYDYTAYKISQNPSIVMYEQIKPSRIRVLSCGVINLFKYIWV